MKIAAIIMVLCLGGCQRDHYIVPRDAVVKPAGRQWVSVWIPTKVDEDGKMVEGVKRWVEVDETWVMVRE